MRRRAVVVVVMFVLIGLVASCGRCPIVDYTVPPTPAVLGTADAVVIATVGGIDAVGDGRIEADIAVADVLFTNLDHEILSEGPLRVGAFDDPCSRRSGMTLADGGSLVVVLRWVGVDNGSWSVPWQAYPVLREHENGTLTFLDTGDGLNARIDQIIPGKTLAGLIEAVSQPDR